MATRNGFKDYTLTPELKELKDLVFKKAAEAGLTHFPIEFLLISPRELNAVAAYGGFPQRIPHWSFGQEFNNLHKRYTYGLSKIYELVINSNPVYAYLVDTNSFVDHKIVMSHVCGHADFFLNNKWFSTTDRNMLNQMANNATRVKRMIEKHGVNKVEEFLDICMSLDNLIDPYLTHIKRKFDPLDEDAEVDEETPRRLPIQKDYMDRYINTKEFMDHQKEKIEENKKNRKNFPESAERDILGFLVDHAPLERWQLDILAMVREEQYYFAPQRMTKIMNEGWASYHHSKMMTNELAEDCDIIDYCDMHSGVVSNEGSSVNPYRIGISLFRDIEDRWNRGAFGSEWERCEDWDKKKNWDRKLGLGKEKIMQVRKTHNDLTFIDEFLTPDFCIEQGLFAAKPAHPSGYIETTEEFREIKSQFLLMLSNGGSPVIQVINANYENRGELLLEHVFDQKTLDEAKCKDTLENLFKLWTRSVHIKTIEPVTEADDAVSMEPVKLREVIKSFDGKNHAQKELGAYNG